MKFPRIHTLKEIANIIGSTYVGADDFSVYGMNEIHVVEPGDIVFVDHPKYYDKALQSAATIVLINKEVACPEGKALLITKTKAAEAEGNAIKIAAQAEKEASQLRGQGVALFREEVAKGMAVAAQQMMDANLDANLILFSMWTEAVKNFAEHGKGNVIFLDGSVEGMQKTMKDMMAINQLNLKDKK